MPPMWPRVRGLSCMYVLAFQAKSSPKAVYNFSYYWTASTPAPYV